MAYLYAHFSLNNMVINLYADIYTHKISVSNLMTGGVRHFTKLFWMVVGARRISVKVDLLGFKKKKKINAQRYVKWWDKQQKKAFSGGQFCRRKHLVSERAQKRIAKLVWADRKTAVTQITTFYNHVEQKSISERWMFRLQLQKTTLGSSPSKEQGSDATAGTGSL